MFRSELRTMWKLAKEAARIEALKWIDALEAATAPKPKKSATHAEEKANQ